MITKEKEVGETLRVTHKKLNLVTPEVAISRAVFTEAPVFVSSGIHDAEICNRCGVEYKPLVYQPGEIVTAHHFHEDSGGIYYKEFSRFMFQGWMAVLELFGKSYSGRDGQASEQARVVQIRAFCSAEICCEELQEGVVFGVPYSNIKDGILRPSCGLERHPFQADYIKYHFKITEDGHVFFSQV